jgi:Arc/MetJ-type ribon-helix-helix transcriptional regulator
MEERHFILELTLPEDLARLVMARVSEGGYADPSAYIQALILADLNGAPPPFRETVP